uniref:Rho-GAP domain-containing protein n=1 Tax=Mesocestoides corti TaxID=53468 RepID=A0A5K3ELM3_MESCO
MPTLSTGIKRFGCGMMEECHKSFRGGTDDSDKKLTGNIGDLLIEYGHGITLEDKLLASKDKNAVDFVQNYSKLWCKCLKDTIRSLEKRAIYENDCMRATVKLFQSLGSSVAATPEAPLSEEILRFSSLVVEQAKETELHNSKRYRELIEVLKRQRTEFAKTREVLKAKWKADVKRMVDAETALFKAKSAYFNRCQAGVKLREDLAAAQAILNESQAGLVAASTANPSPAVPPPPSGAAPTNGGLAPGISASAESVSDNPTIGTTQSPPVDPALFNAVVKYKGKVERLEKQLGDNDKKEMELMYAYRESVEAANARLVDLEKSRVEIICDTRLTVVKCDEVVSDSMAELISHLFVTRTKMLSEYEDVATKFQNYIPGQPYHQFLQKHVQNGTDVILEKYQFDGYHDNPANAKDRGDAAFGKFVSRFAQLYSKDTSEPNEGRHSDSDTEVEESAPQGNTTVLSSLVQFGSNLFRPDAKKASVRAKGRSAASAAAVELDPATVAAMEAAAEREYDKACFVLIQCINGIETQKEGLQTHGIYRVPASKIKVAAVVEAIRVAEESGYSSIDLSEEYAITLASTLKTRLIQLPEPLLSYNLYDQFVVVGKALDGADSATVDEQAKKLHNLICQLSPANQRVAGLLFHHLKRISTFRSVNQMGAANLATMFGPTVLRQKPKFNVANMMEFVDNNWLMKAVELCIDRVSDVFGPDSDFATNKLLQVIRAKRAEIEPAEAQVTSSSSPVAIFSAPVPAVADPREAFFADMSGASALATQPPTTWLKISTSKSEQTSPLPADRKSVRSRTSVDLERVTPESQASGASTAQKDVPPTRTPEPTAESSSSGGSGFKRLIGAKAQNLHQRFQNLTSGYSEGAAKSGLVFSPRKLLHSASLRNSPGQKPRKQDTTPRPSKDTTKGLHVADCSFIDTG